MEKVYETRINNLLPTIYHLYESNGQRVCSISAKGWMNITSVSPLSTYARWERLDVYRDRIEFYQRSGWEEPVRGQFEIELLNTDGAEVEERGGIFLPKHVPVRVGVTLESPLIWYSKIEIRRVWERRKSPLCSGYYQRVPVTKDVKTLRPETELAWLRGLMESQGVEPPPLEEVAQEQPSEFECVFENKMESPITIFSDTGRPFFSIPAEKSLIVEAYSPEAMFSRYRKIVIKKDKIDLEKNKAWRNPYLLSIELINEDGCPIEAVTLGGKSWNVLRGIPRFVPIDVLDPDVFFKTFTWKKERVKKTRPTLPGYFETEEHVALLKEPRSEKEIEELRIQRKAKLMGRR